MDQHYAVIIKADGSIPFDEDVPTVHRQAIIDSLKADGHDIHYDPETNCHKSRNHKVLGRT